MTDVARHPSLERQAEWRALVEALRDASRPGGPLDGWAFHGTAARYRDGIDRVGLDSSPVLVREGGERVWAEGVYLGSADMAAHFALDAVDGFDPPDAGLIVVVDVSRLDERDLAQDEASLDDPVVDVLGREAGDCLAACRAAGGGWRASLEAVGAFAHLGRIEASNLLTLRDVGDLEALLRAAPGPA